MLYTPEYQQVLRDTHSDYPLWGFGHTVSAWPNLRQFVESLDVTTVVDYGCANAGLKAFVEGQEGNTYVIHEYDPGIPGKDTPPPVSDFVISCDVLEHVEPELVDNVLSDIQRLATKGGYLEICLVPAFAKLTDGRNAHLTVKPAEWWLEKLDLLFVTEVKHITRGHLAVYLRPK